MTVIRDEVRERRKAAAQDAAAARAGTKGGEVLDVEPPPMTELEVAREIIAPAVGGPYKGRLLGAPINFGTRHLRSGDGHVYGSTSSRNMVTADQLHESIESQQKAMEEHRKAIDDQFNRERQEIRRQLKRERQERCRQHAELVAILKQLFGGQPMVRPMDASQAQPMAYTPSAPQPTQIQQQNDEGQEDDEEDDSDSLE